MEIIVFIIVAVIFYIVILPFINNFGGNSPHKDSGKITKTKEALKEVGNNYRETKEAISKGLSVLEKGIDSLKKESEKWPEKAERYRLEEYEKNYHRIKQKVEKINKEYKELGLKEVSLVDFFAYNKDYQERARKDIEALEAKKRAERLVALIDEHDKREKAPKSAKPVTNTNTEFSQKKPVSNSMQDEAIVFVEKNESPVIENLNRPVNIELNKLSIELIEFIYIRYYLTGEKSLPKLKCIYDSWATTVYADSELNEAQWVKIIEKMSFNPIKRKKIDALYHFTHKDNLPSILSNGLLTKKNLEEQNIKYKYNDEKRLDGINDSISLSFSHPNWKMFYKYRAITGLKDWVVFKISPELLSGNTNSDLSFLNDFDYLDKTIFCKKNAAHFTERTKTVEERKSHKVFLDIFESTIDIELLTYPYLNESEILYQGNIPKEFIKEIHTVEEDKKLTWVQDLGFKLSVNQTVFEKR